MPRKPRTPRYQLHKPTGQAYTYWKGRRHYFGRHGTPEAEEAYRRFVAELFTRPQVAFDAALASPGRSIEVIQICAAYWQHAEAYYVKDGKPTSQQATIRCALRLVREFYGHTPAVEFGPLALQAIQAKLIEQGKARKTIGHTTAAVKSMFKWAVSQELLPGSVCHALATVGMPKKGRTAAKETAPVAPVENNVVEATLPFLPAVVADMVRLQRFAGMRPGEVCQLRPCDLDRSKEVWEYRPASHKTQHHGRDRVVFIGPRAQDVLRPYLLRPAHAYCFCPAESETKRRQDMRSRRKSKVQPSQANRAKARPKRKPKDRYVKDAYNRAIARACEKAFGMPEELRKISSKLPQAEQEALRKRAAEWRAKHCWTPNQLRHAAGTEIRRQFGLEAAQVTLGHSTADVTQVYAERDQSLAASVMKRIG